MGWLTSAPIWWVTLAAGSLVEACLGFLLGFPLINKLFLSESVKAREKAARIREKVATKQGMLGVLGLIVGAWMIVASFLFAIV